MIFKEIDTIFIHVPKSGGTTITRDIARKLYKGKFRDFIDLYDKKELTASPKSKGKAHSKASDYLNYLGEEYYNYYSFAIIRNPFTQIRSLYNQLTNMNARQNPRFKVYKKMSFYNFIFRDDKFGMNGESQRSLINQKEMVCKGDEVIVNDLFPFDYFKDVIKILKDKGLPVIGKTVLRKTDGDQKYSPKMINAIMEEHYESYDLYRKVKKNFEDKYLNKK